MPNNTEEIISLPTILDYLTEQEISEVRFIKPNAEKDLIKLNLKESLESPAANVMAISKLQLAEHTVIPFHRHEWKEKVYVHDGNSYVEVLIQRDGKIQKFSLMNPGDRLVIPQGCPHAVHVRRFGNKIYSYLLIVASTNNSDDVTWEADTKELLLNKHLAKK